MMSADFHRAASICLKEILDASEIALFGFSDYGDALPLLQCRAAALVPAGAKSVISCAFPYYIAGIGAHNLSRYASICDYHPVLEGILARACTALSEKFPDSAFVPFADNSPLREVACAVRAGLGMLGDNGLLITKDYGSYVFLGEIVTDLPLPATKFAATCLHCGRCAARCPAGCLGTGSEKKSHCLSAVTQKKRITDSEAAMISENGFAWGCDLCAEVCPLCANIKETRISAFRDSFHPLLSLDEVGERLESSAFNWRGRGPIERNLQILSKVWLRSQ